MSPGWSLRMRQESVKNMQYSECFQLDRAFNVIINIVL